MRRHLVLVVGDCAALVVFALVGLASHDKGMGASDLARDAVPVVAGWLIAAGMFDLYRRGGRLRFLRTWFVGITGGTIVRGLVLHRNVAGVRYLTFLLVSLIVTLVFLLAWRGAYWIVRNRIDSTAHARE
jgi:uncharacterized membrane protein YjjP (DUF1212 family)